MRDENVLAVLFSPPCCVLCLVVHGSCTPTKTRELVGIQPFPITIFVRDRMSSIDASVCVPLMTLMTQRELPIFFSQNDHGEKFKI
jgi:hypothetical protein